MPSLFKKKSTAKGVTSVVFTPQGVAFAYVDNSQAQPLLKHCDFIASSDPRKDVGRFKTLIDKLELSGSQALMVLPESAYQLHLIERPEVADDELVAALQWRLKDLVSFDIEQAVIDYIELPEDAYRGRAQMIYAVTAEKKRLDQLAHWCEEIGLTPVVADIPELALLNLTEDLADTEAGLAVFCIGEESSSINLLSDSALYFTRHLSYNQQSSSEHAATAVLELQRSLDYYESQIGKPPCVRLMVMPFQEEENPLMSELRYNLGLDIHSLDLANLIDSDIELPARLQQHVTVAIAAALRSDKTRYEVKR